MSVVDDYLKNVPGPQAEELKRVRKIIKQTAPDAEEVITYAMPGFKYKNKYLIAFAPFKNHMSVFPGSEATEVLKSKLNNYKLGKGTIQFTLDNPLPEAVIKELVLQRMTDITKK